jgi:hypothetical protein
LLKASSIFQSFKSAFNHVIRGLQKTSQKECSGVVPITDFIPNVKSSLAMLDLEQTLNELGSFVRRLTDDKQKNIQEIQTQPKEICEEIHKI